MQHLKTISPKILQYKSVTVTQGASSLGAEARLTSQDIFLAIFARTLNARLKYYGLHMASKQLPVDTLSRYWATLTFICVSHQLDEWVQDAFSGKTSACCCCKQCWWEHREWSKTMCWRMLKTLCRAEGNSRVGWWFSVGTSLQPLSHYTATVYEQLIL